MCFCKLSKLILYSLSGPSGNTDAAGLGVGISAAVLVLVLIVFALLFFWKRGSDRKREKEKEISDFNPVYATYQVHDDPVAEVRKSALKNPLIPCLGK